MTKASREYFQSIFLCGDGLITSSKNGLFPLRILVLWVCSHTFTLTTGLMLLPGSCRPSMTRTRIWALQTAKSETAEQTARRVMRIVHEKAPLIHYTRQTAQNPLKRISGHLMGT